MLMSNPEGEEARPGRLGLPPPYKVASKQWSDQISDSKGADLMFSPNPRFPTLALDTKVYYTTLPAPAPRRDLQQTSILT